MTTVFTIISCLFAIAGYFALVFSFFPRFWTPLIPNRPYLALSQRRLVIGIVAISLPLFLLLVYLWIAKDIGVVFSHGDRETIFGFCIFPFVSIIILIPFKILSFLAVPFAEYIKSKKTPNEIELQFGKPDYMIPTCGCGLSGCLIPLLFFISTSIILAALGDNYHFEYNPSMDGPRKTFFWHGMDWILFFSTIQGMGFLTFGSTTLLFILAVYLDFISPKTIDPDTGIATGKQFSWIRFAFMTSIMIVCILYPIFFIDVHPRYASRPPSCERNLLQIGLSIHSYRDKHGNSPPACSIDSVGKPLHSWRVLILPFIEQQHLYEQIRLDEPWNSEHNRRFHYAAPKIFQCPELFKNRKWDEQKNLCDYAMVVHPNKLDNEDQNKEANPKRKIFIVERKVPVCWMDPIQELTPENLSENLGRIHNSKTHVLFDNGEVELVNEVK